MRKIATENPGSVHRLWIESDLLVGNRPGDPAARDLVVYTPPDYDSSQTYPLFMDLVGYTGSGASHANWKPFGYNLPERLDRLIGAGRMGPVVAVMPDCFTAYGGNQYINSGATGPYMDYLVDEVIPFVEARFSVGRDAAHRAVFGKSSGGYGALVHGLLRPDVWGAAACHSGDAYFEFCYLPDLPGTLAVLQKYEQSVEKFLQAVWAREKISKDEGMALMLVGMAAHYDPEPANPLGFEFPAHLHTGEMRWDRWENWLAHDPVRMVDTRAEALGQLRGLYIDCGTKDQFNLLWGARILHEKLTRAGVAHAYHEFDDNHSDVDYRMDESLPFLYQALTS